MRLSALVTFFGLAMALIPHNALARDARAVEDPTSLSFADTAFDFQYWQFLEPYEQISCHHAKADDFFDWDVTCEGKGITRQYRVHLVVHFYPQTIYGKSAYEILYWVTDRSLATQAHRHSSSTIWVHNSSEDNRMRLLQVEQGVENDLAALRLAIRPHSQE